MTFLSTLKTSNFSFIFFIRNLWFIVLIFMRFIFLLFFYKIFLYNDFVFYVFMKVVLAFQYHIGHRTILNPYLKLLNLFLFDIEV